MRWVVCFTLLLMSMTGAIASENENNVIGRLIQIDNNIVVVSLDKEENIVNGSPIVFFEEIPGVGEISVKGSWTVISQNGIKVKAKAKPGSSSPQIGCKARLQASFESSTPSVKENTSTNTIQSNIVPPVKTIKKSSSPTWIPEKDPLVLKYTSKPWMGVFLGKRINSKGVYILSVVPNSTAFKFNIKRGDAITQFGRNKIDTVKQLINAIGKAFPERNYTLRIIRNKKQLSLNIRLKTLTLSQSILRAGRDYQKGRGVEKNESRAVALLRKAAKLGEAGADYTLGVMYQEGKGGLSRNDKKCIKHLKKAAQKNNLLALNLLGKLYRYGEIVLQDQALARTYYLRASDRGLIAATEAMGYQYYNGQGGSVDKVRAAEYWGWAASFGYASSQNALGYMYYVGEGGLARNWNIAEYWFQHSANHDNAHGKEWLARIQREKKQQRQKQASQKQKRQQQNQKSMELFLQTMKQFQKLK